MDLYTGKINEFVDWVTGKNSYTGANTTGGRLVSGGSIRELLQNKLKNPFYMYEDKTLNRYRMFSSEDAFAIWKEDPSNNQDLELFNFVRPSEYKLDLTAIDSDGFNNKFVRYGDTNSTGTRIAFSWNIYNDNEPSASDSLSVTYTISNTSTGASTTFTRWYNRSDANPNFSIYDYLQAGENVVTIQGRGSSTGATSTKTFTIVLLQVSIDSTFLFNDKFSPNVPLLVPYVFERNNTSGTAKIYFQIDGGGEGKLYSRDVVENGPTRVVETQMLQASLTEGQHSLQVWAETKYNDGNTVVNSNLLYYTFTIASSRVGSTGKFINISKSFDSGNFPLSDLMLTATQYESQQLSWGYYTDSLQSNTSISVTWKLLDGLNDTAPTTLITATANSQEKAPTLSFVPTIYTQEGHDTYLAAYFTNGDTQTLITTIPIYIVKNNKVVVNETGFYEVKMSAYGRTNESNDRASWTDVAGNVKTDFTNIQWNTNSGWYNNSFRTSGADSYATIDVQPFSNFNFTTGKTIEIDFESEKVSDEEDKLIVIGNPTGARIEITPDTATLYSNANTEVVHTNYKANERLKLAFIVNNIPEEADNRTVESGLAYIVNNGILERAAAASGYAFSTQGSIKIGGVKSGVRVYSLRIYNYAITYTDAYNNYLYDSNNKAQIADSNNILDSAGEISFDLCKNKIDTILISGDLSKILSGQSDKEGSTTDVTIERFCPSDATKNFKISNVQIRKHGQSTLNYPITSMKFWLNKSKSGVTPTYDTTQQADLLLNKNRYVMKAATDSGKPSIPANKFVLQANYADSSGVHNGGLQRLIQSTWFNAQIDGEYKLRTAPQLFSTSTLVHHNNTTLGEDGWVEGYGEGNKQWKDVTAQQFPYDIRVSPDSFPCAVFYYDENGSKKRTFLGQYVWMDDKKSDFLYGERSIYNVPTDPFCLTNTYKSEDTKENRVWNNNDVLRIEVVGSNVPFTSYMTHNNFDSIVSVTDETTQKTTQMYNWEQAFELIYPDEDDLIEKDAKNGIDKFNPNSAYVAKVKPFLDFHEWVVSTYKNQAKFQVEAAEHLDLYKMAAYYIFVLRFGLVDSLERNAQIKTYDGVHWHYEPWDMDIALGNKNDGGIAYNPPIDRNTKLPGSVTTYAISGRSANEDGTIATSNWLFDALEAWPYWANTIVPQVADALYTAGLTYNNIAKMFDDNYAAAWCELMYNDSGFFKYVESGKGDPTWLSWLLGSRMTHRHWWLSNSMDYYDAKWFCGDYKNHYIYVQANVTEGSNQNVRITPNKATYMTVYKDGIPQATQSVSQDNPLVFSMSGGSNTKNPILFYGANFMEEIDLSEIAAGFDGIMLGGVLSAELGSPLKRLNVGVKLTEDGSGYTTTLATLGCNLRATTSTDSAVEGGFTNTADVYSNLQYLNVRGQLNFTDTNTLIENYDMTQLEEFRAMGSGLLNFYSSRSGNTFTTIELPDTVANFWVNNSTWQDLQFWHAETDVDNNTKLTQVIGVPSTITTVSLMGTTGSTKASLQFVREWLNKLTEEEADFSQYTLNMDKVNWYEGRNGITNSDLLTYEELSKIARLNSASSIKGYLVLRNTGEDLAANQLNNIKAWFGDTVFTKNSSGLVIDHARLYVQINIGGDVSVDADGNVTIVEGKTASLNATKFTLADDNPSNYQWAVGPTDSNEGYGAYQGLSVIQYNESADGFVYLTSTQSKVGHDYDAKIYTSVSGVNYSTTIHVVAATYPEDVFINSTLKEGLVSLRTAPGFIEFPSTSASETLYADSNIEYTGLIRAIEYTVTRLSDNVSVKYNTNGSDTALTQFDDQYIKLAKSTTHPGIKVSVPYAVSEEAQLYKLEAVCMFTSGKTLTASATIVVQEDSKYIVGANKLPVFNPLKATYYNQFGEEFTKNGFYKVDLMAITSTIDFTEYAGELGNFITYNNDSYLFKYLPNCTGLIIDGATSLTSNVTIAGKEVNLMDFSNMTKLKTLHILNCTGLTEDIDLTICTDIEDVDASGTSINVLVPENTKVTTYELGTPTKVSLINPTSITPSKVKVDNSSNIDSIDLVNIPDNKSFNTFAKIMGL